jgi:hypothetical protein
MYKMVFYKTKSYLVKMREVGLLLWQEPIMTSLKSINLNKVIVGDWRKC